MIICPYPSSCARTFVFRACPKCACTFPLAYRMLWDAAHMCCVWGGYLRFVAKKYCDTNLCDSVHSLVLFAPIGFWMCECVLMAHVHTGAWACPTVVALMRRVTTPSAGL